MESFWVFRVGLFSLSKASHKYIKSLKFSVAFLVKCSWRLVGLWLCLSFRCLLMTEYLCSSMRRWRVTNNAQVEGHKWGSGNVHLATNMVTWMDNSNDYHRILLYAKSWFFFYLKSSIFLYNNNCFMQWWQQSCFLSLVLLENNLLFNSQLMYMYQATLTHMLWKLCALCYSSCMHVFVVIAFLALKKLIELIVKYIREKS